MPRGGDQSARHRAVVRAVRDAAPSVGWVLWAVGQSHRRPTRSYDTPGVPDLLGCTGEGRLVGVEIKTGRGRLSDHQCARRIEMERRGALWMQVGSVEEFAALAALGPGATA